MNKYAPESQRLNGIGVPSRRDGCTRTVVRAKAFCMLRLVQFCTLESNINRPLWCVRHVTICVWRRVSFCRNQGCGVRVL